jgi:hypothetical protein
MGFAKGTVVVVVEVVVDVVPLAVTVRVNVKRPTSPVVSDVLPLTA